MRLPILFTTLLLAVCVSLATYLEPRAPTLDGKHGQGASLIETLMGDSRRLFATHFLLKADAYFHSGFYPSIFDRPKGFEEAHLAEASTAEHMELRADAKPEEQHEPAHEEHDHAQDHDEKDAGFGGESRDWIDQFSRHFMPSAHTHLDGAGQGANERQGDAREILPWLKLAAELDPNRAETYTLAGHWLRTRMGKVKEAEEFLREGLCANPGDPTILFELGRIAEEAKNDPARARTIWELALQKWRERELPKKDPDTLLLSQIALHLAKLEEKAGQYEDAITHWNLVKPVSPRPEEVEKRIAELKAKQAESSK